MRDRDFFISFPVLSLTLSATLGRVAPNGNDVAAVTFFLIGSSNSEIAMPWSCVLPKMGLIFIDGIRTSSYLT
jgi:hypothetical protein